MQDIPLINTLLGPFVLESFSEEELVALAGTAAPDQSDLSGDSDDSEPYRGESHPSETAKMARNATSNQGDLPDDTESGISRSTKKDMLIDAVFHLESLDKPTKTFALKAEQEKSVLSIAAFRQLQKEILPSAKRLIRPFIKKSDAFRRQLSAGACWRKSFPHVSLSMLFSLKPIMKRLWPLSAK